VASSADVLRLRRLADAADTTIYPSQDLSDRIDAAGTVEVAAADLWREKAAGYAALVDTTEGNSSRKLSQLQQQALAMAKQYDKPDVVVALDARPRSRAITRG
jgi:hypothetical protein